jgi:hypothetical protein
MIRRLHLVSLVALIAMAGVRLYGATSGAVSGTVRDSSGVPQIGAAVELLRPDMTVVAAVYTNSKGLYTFANVLPGHYAVKAMGTSFLPSLRENVRVRANTVVNLTLSTLYEVMQWLPAEPKSANAKQDDWEFAGAVESLAAVSIHPVVEGPESQGLDEVTLRSAQTINLGDEFEIEAGSQQVLARFGQNSPNAVLAALPFTTVSWHGPTSTLSYRMATELPVAGPEEPHAGYSLPRMAMHDGKLTMEHGMHHEISWERRTDSSGVSFMVFSDRVEHPVIEARGTASAGDDVLRDTRSGLIRGTGQDFSSAGVLATVEHRMAGGDVKLAYANGNAMVMPAVVRSTGMNQILAAARPRRAQMYAISLSGTIEGTGTRWRASYRWQPADTVTAIAPYSVGAMEPYLNLHLRQPISTRSNGVNVEALLNVSNLLAEGYRPYLTNSGMVVFAQDQRSVGAGVAFTF